MNEVLFVDTSQSFQDFHEHSQSLFEGEGFSWESCLVGEEVSLVAVVKNQEDEVRCVDGGFLSDYVFVVELFHDLDFLFDVFLKEGFLFDLGSGDDFDGEELVDGFWVRESYFFWRGGLLRRLLCRWT